MLSLLQNIEAMSACRDRSLLPRALVRAVATLLGEQADIGILARDALGDISLKLFHGPNVSNPVVFQWLDLVDEIRSDGKVIGRCTSDRCYGVLLLQASELATDQLILAFDVNQTGFVEHSEKISSLARMYANQVSLLDYSELDSLTRLLNRKTFDETFDRLLTAVSNELPDGGFGDRRDGLTDDTPAWLCVIDIDHFKRVNDSFGHLFGDEVLLRMGELMRKTFRGGDRLFRFGGEEFVVILNAANRALAEAGFDRFRLSVESHEFPQVGQVTCSIGFTGVSSLDVPTDVVGRADEALYYAKEHGRNQVCCHEQLIAEGAIAQPFAAEAPLEADFDMDALFA